MTKLVLTCSKDGSFREVKASGHAGFAGKGEDIVCAAESFLLRTAIDVLEKSGRNLLLEKDLSVRGKLSCRLVQRGMVSNERLSCVADFIREGMQSLAEEYPDSVSFQELFED